MDPTKLLERSMPQVLTAVVSAAARLSLHLAGKHRLPRGEVDRLCTILTNFLEAIDALPPEP